jgi:Ca-activated chloride channel homolog
MSFASPSWLALLVLVPLALLGYRWLLRRRAVRRSELAKQGMVLTAGSNAKTWRRHLPVALFIPALACLALAAARPQAAVGLPRREGTVILAFDVSTSMRADDLKPNRMQAAKEAAKIFVAQQPNSIKIGIVAFSDGGLVTQQPTTDQQAVLGAIDRLSPQGATSLGQGIFASLNAIATERGDPIKLSDEQLSGQAESVDIGFFGSASIVMLSDGENTGEPDPQVMAQLASTAGVKITTIGIGSPEGTVLEVDGFSVATALDATALQQIAEITDGTYLAAEDAAALKDVYGSLKLELRTVKEQRELTGVAAGAAAILLALGGAFSMWWFGRVIP